MKIIDPADPKPALIFGLNLLCQRFFGYICQIFCPKTFQFQALLRLVEMIKPFPLDFHFPVTGFIKMLFTYGIQYMFVNLVIDGYILDINILILIIVVCAAGNPMLLTTAIV